MKRIIIFLSLCAVFMPCKSWATAGEFVIYQTGTPVQLTLTLQSSGYAWKWNSATGKVILSPAYNQTFSENNHFGFDCPKNVDVAKNGVMLWGLMQFTLSSITASISFTIDFRDENWATGYVNPDIALYFNPTNGSTYLQPPSGSNTQVTNGATINIWDVYHRDGGPLQTDLLLPVFLKNLINSANAGGMLHVDSYNYNSGDTALADYNYNHNIGTNNERISNPGGTYKHNNWNNSASDYLLSRSVTIQATNDEQDANFTSLFTAILCNSVDGTVVTDANGGFIPFVDPWYMSDGGGSQPGTPVNIPSGNSPTGAYNQSSGGVFLNQDYNIAGNPHYSLQAPVSQPISNHTAFFGGWSASPSGYVTFQNATSPTTALVFTSAGATITANYIYSVVASNATLPAGTYTFAGSLTVNSGATLTLSSGTTLNFPSGAGLTVNGLLVANGATFTQSSSGWNGITLNSANGSSLNNCTISYANLPLTINSTSNVSVSGGAINNSNFGYDAAIRVYGSTPTISGVSISGLSSAYNGVRFASGSGGVLQECTIQGLTSGNGVVVQTNSSPTITDNVIQNNHFHGIIVTGNGTGSPNINHNDVESNGIVNGTKTYCGIVFDGSRGYVQSNAIRYSNFGIYCLNSASPQSYISLGDRGGNTIMNNLSGIVVLSQSYPTFGSGYAPSGHYYGVCNEIHDNTNYDVVVEGNSNLYVQYNWWGQYPVNMAKHFHDATSYLYDANPEQSSGDCPLSGGESLVVFGTKGETAPSNGGIVIPISPDSLIKSGMDARNGRKWELAKSFFTRVLQSDAAAAYRQQAAVLLFNLFQENRDTSIVSLIAPYRFSANEIGSLSAELLASMYAAMGRLSDAETVANQLRAKYAGTEIEQRALVQLASLSAFDKSYADKSSSALNELVKKFGSTVDMGLVVALNTADNKEFPGTANPSISDAQENATTITLSNYPNPFNPSTTIYYQIPKDSKVAIKIFDELGREVRTLVDEQKTTGKYSIEFDASRLASGIYFYSIHAGEYMAVKKMLLLK